MTGRRSNQLSHWAFLRRIYLQNRIHYYIHPRFYRLLSDHSISLCFSFFHSFLSHPVVFGSSISASLLSNDLYTKFLWRLRLQKQVFRSNPRPISSSQLHTLLHFHLCPIYLVVFKGSYYLRMGYLILRGASRLDAFSVYPFPTWLPGHAPGGTTGTPVVSPTRSSRTKVSSSQISYAHAG